MAKKIAFLNGKGGCGKSTSLYHISGVLSLQGKRILVLDLDKQKNVTNTFLMNNQCTPEVSVYDCLMSIFKDADRAIIPALFQTHGNAVPKYYGVDVIPGDARLEYINYFKTDGIEKMREHFDALTAHRGYDFVLIDMPPSNIEINRICLGYLADYVLVPFSSDLFSLSGYGDILTAVESAREDNPDLDILGVFLARHMSYCGVDRYIREQMLNLDTFIDIQIPLSADVREAVMFGRPISYYKKDSNSKRAYEALVEEIIKRTERA